MLGCICICICICICLDVFVIFIFKVAKYTDLEAMEFETVRTATERTREILESIDKQVIIW